MALVNVVRASRGTKVDLTWAMASAAWPAVVQASHLRLSRGTKLHEPHHMRYLHQIRFSSFNREMCRCVSSTDHFTPSLCTSASACIVRAFPPQQISAFKSQPDSENREGRGTEGWDHKLWGCASTVIFFITEPALTQIMECTGSLSESQWGESGPLPTLGYANPSAAVWV